MADKKGAPVIKKNQTYEFRKKSATQKQAYLGLTDQKGNFAKDLDPGVSVYDNAGKVLSSGHSEFANEMRSLRNYANINAEFMNKNLTITKPSSDGLAHIMTANRPKYRRVLSEKGFPEGVKVAYFAAPPTAIRAINSKGTPLYSQEERIVTHFVFHSFGHGWDVGKYRKNKKGERKKRELLPKEYHKDLGLKNVPQPNNVWVHPRFDPKTGGTIGSFGTRFDAGLRRMLNTAEGCAVHFLVNREGDLVVIGSLDDAYDSQKGGLDPSAITVELEEAFYADTPRDLARKTFRSQDGLTLANAGTLKPLDYTEAQWKTLAVLIKKLEFAYPVLDQSEGAGRGKGLEGAGGAAGNTINGRVFNIKYKSLNLSQNNKVNNITGQYLGPEVPTTPGYTMHAFIKELGKVPYYVWDESNSKRSGYTLRKLRADQGTEVGKTEGVSSSHQDLSPHAVRLPKDLREPPRDYLPDSMITAEQWVKFFDRVDALEGFKSIEDIFLPPERYDNLFTPTDINKDKEREERENLVTSTAFRIQTQEVSDTLRGHNRIRDYANQTAPQWFIDKENNAKRKATAVSKDVAKKESSASSNQPSNDGGGSGTTTPNPIDNYLNEGTGSKSEHSNNENLGGAAAVDDEEG